MAVDYSVNKNSEDSEVIYLFFDDLPQYKAAHTKEAQSFINKIENKHDRILAQAALDKGYMMIGGERGFAFVDDMGFVTEIKGIYAEGSDALIDPPARVETESRRIESIRGRPVREYSGSVSKTPRVIAPPQSVDELFTAREEAVKEKPKRQWGTQVPESSAAPKAEEKHGPSEKLPEWGTPDPEKPAPPLEEYRVLTSNPFGALDLSGALPQSQSVCSPGTECGPSGVGGLNPPAASKASQPSKGTYLS